jgi:hypothetical protein
MTAEKLVYGLVFAGCVLYAQAQPPAAGTAATPPQIHLNVVALDSHNEPVVDLAASDFQITDQGKPQRIVSFRKAGLEPPAAANEFSNRSAGGGQTTVLLLDLLNQGRMDGLESSRRLGRGLAQLSSGDSLFLYIVALDGSLYPIHPIPAPGASAGDPAWVKSADGQIQAALSTVNKARKAGMTLEDNVKKTYVNLETLAKNLSIFPGSRNIVWITDGVPAVFAEKNSTGESAGPSAPSGARTSMLGDAGDTFAAYGSSCGGDWFGSCALYLPHLSVRLAGTKTTVDTLTYTVSPDTNAARDMDFFANSTGGRSYSEMEIGGVLAQMASDAKSAYEVTYQPAPENWDQKFHKIKVTCARKGLKIQAKTHYFAVPVAEQKAPGAAVAKDEDSALIAALESPVDIPGIGLNVAVSPAAGGKKALHFQIRIDATDLQLREQAGAFDDQIAVMFADYTANGLKGVPLPSDFSLHLTPEQRAKVMKDGLSFGVDHAVDNTIREVRFVVFDHASNAYGSLSIPVAPVEAPPAH